MNIEIKGTVIKTQTEDGYELDSLLVEPKKKTNKIVIHFHGKEGDFLQNHFTHVMAEKYVSDGIAFMTASHRGRSYIADILRKSATGYEFNQMGSAFDIFEDSVYDIDAWVKIAKAKGYDEIFLQQHSTPQKIAWYVHKKNTESIKGLILISPSDILYLFEKYVPDYENNLKLSEKLVKEGKVRDIMPVNLWSNCPVSAATFLNWGSKESNIQLFNYLHPEKGFKYFPEIKLPILAVLAENDFAVGNPANECLEMLGKNTGSKSFKSILIGDGNHGYQGKEEGLAAVIANWIKKLQ